MMREVFQRHLGYKVASFVLAILFWLWVMNQAANQNLTGDQVLTIPLVTKGQSQDLIVMSKLPSVRVRLQGSVNTKDLFAYVDLSGATPGEHTYQVKMDALQGVNVIDIQPQTISLQVDTVQEKVLPVEVKMSGNPAIGYQAGTPVVRPASVNVRGPSSVLGMLDKVTVDSSISGASESIQASYPVMFRDKAGKPIYGPDLSVDVLTSSPKSVDVVVPIYPKDYSNKTIPVKVATTGTPGNGLSLRSLTPVPGSVQVSGEESALKGIDTLTLGPIDVSGLTEDKVFQIPTEKVALPAGISLIPGTGFTVMADIGLGPVQKTVSNVPVETKNIGDGLQLEQPMAPLTITIEGYPEVVDQIRTDQIKLWVDAAGLSAGNYPNGKVYWQLPPGVKMIGTPQVSFTLKSSQ